MGAWISARQIRWFGGYSHQIFPFTHQKSCLFDEICEVVAKLATKKLQLCRALAWIHNYLRSFHGIRRDHETLLFLTKDRLLLERFVRKPFWILRRSVIFEDQKKFDLLAILHSEELELYLAYLVDILKGLNNSTASRAGTAILSSLTIPFEFLYCQFALMETSDNDDHPQLIQTHLFNAQGWIVWNLVKNYFLLMLKVFQWVVMKFI